MELPAEVQASVEALSSKIGDVSDALAPVLSRDLKELEDVLAESPLECAKLHAALAYSLESLFFMYLRSSGLSPAEHPVRAELERVKAYIKKIKDVQAKVAKKRKHSASSTLTSSSSAAATLDKGAAERLVRRALAKDDIGDGDNDNGNDNDNDNDNGNGNDNHDDDSDDDDDDDDDDGAGAGAGANADGGAEKRRQRRKRKGKAKKKQRTSSRGSSRKTG